MAKKYIHPLLSISCNLLTPTDIEGTSKPRDTTTPNSPIPNSKSNVPMAISITAAPIYRIKYRRTNNQYSCRLALPSNTAYFF
jgi:hypothetical protein